MEREMRAGKTERRMGKGGVGKEGVEGEGDREDQEGKLGPGQ